MHYVLKILSYENLENFDIPNYIKKLILNIVEKLKIDSFKNCKINNSKGYYFSHYHYNVLFL
jgi:hypothetical protein